MVYTADVFLKIAARNISIFEIRHIQKNKVNKVRMSFLSRATKVGEIEK